MVVAVGIIAGSGQFPFLVAKGIRKQGKKVCICGFKGITNPSLTEHADTFTLVHLGKVQKVIDFFKNNLVHDLCLAGAIKKPKISEMRLDFRAARMFLRLRSLGDDSLLRAVANELVKEGISVIQAASFVDNLYAPAGVMTSRKPSEEEWDTIRYAWPIGKALGHYDIGQFLVMQRRMVVAVEAVEGTNETIRRGGLLGGKGCVALKMLKPEQDTRVDLPALGLDTIRLLAEQKYSCLAYEAHSCLFFDLQESIMLADKFNMVVLGITPDLLDPVSW